MANQTRSRGQIIERGKDKWYVKIFRGRDADGKKLYHRKVINGKKSDAQKYLTAKLREKDLGIVIETSRQTLNEHLDYWLKLIKASVKEQTYNGYESLLRVHVRPRIGGLRLTSVKHHDVQKIYTDMITAGSSPNTVHHVHAPLSMAMEKAVELNYLGRNPCSHAVLPKLIKDETKAFSPQQSLLFLKHAKNNKHGLIFEFALVSGMRPGEYLSLRWSDVDFARHTASVRRALVWGKGGGYKFGAPKTKKSRRTITIPKDLILKLKAHRKQQLEHRLKQGRAYENLDLVFASEIGTPIHYRNLTLRHYDKVLKAAGMDKEGFVLYSLRHTCATLLLVKGENPKVVSERLGHSSVKVTLDTYSHVMPETERGASDKLASLLYNAKSVV